MNGLKLMPKFMKIISNTYLIKLIKDTHDKDWIIHLRKRMLHNIKACKIHPPYNHMLSHKMSLSHSWKKSPSEKLTFSCQKNSPLLSWNLKVHYWSRKSPPLVPTLSQPNPAHTLTLHFLLLFVVTHTSVGRSVYILQLCWFSQCANKTLSFQLISYSDNKYLWH